MDSLQKAKYLLENNVHMVLSTADAAGQPSVSPVFFMYDHHYNLFWVSSQHAQHSRNIRSRPQAAIVVFGQLPDGRYDGVYFDAEASELSDETEIAQAIRIYSKRPQPSHFTVTSPADITGDAAWRIYKAVPVSVSKCTLATDHGQTITVREPLSL